MKRITCFTLSAVMVCAFSVSALAEGFALTDWGARGTALGGGMVGRANDPSAVAHNPAGITQLPGTQIMGGLTTITPMGTLETTDPRTGRSESTKVERNWWANPHFYMTHQYNDDVYLGVGVFSRFGLGNSYPSDWMGRANLVNVKLQTVSLNPNFAYKVNDNLSLAVGVDLMYASMRMEKDQNLGPLGFDRQTMTGDSIGFGLNLAAHYIFNEEWAAGLTYRSRVKQDVKGDSSWDRQISNPIVNIADSDLHGTLNLPDVFTFGVTYTPNDQWSFELGTVYTMWSVYQSLDIYLEEPMNTVGFSPKNWKDTWAFNLSTEYKALDWLTLRAGYVYETSPMDKATMDYMTPSKGRQRFSGGVGFNWDQWTLDLGYSYILIRNINYDDSAKSLPNKGVLSGNGHSGNAHVLAATVGYKF